MPLTTEKWIDGSKDVKLIQQRLSDGSCGYAIDLRTEDGETVRLELRSRWSESLALGNMLKRQISAVMVYPATQEG